MELDKRIIDGKKPLTCFDTEQAMQFIGKQCYFSDDATDFMDLDKADGDTMFYVAELQNIWTAEEYCFADNSNDWRYILPVEFVKEEKKEPEKKYRPYTMKEFLREYSIGESILKIRDKREPEYVYQYLFIGHSKNYVGLGGWMFAFKELFDHFEIGDGVGDEETWQPFGVIEDEIE